MKNLADMRQKKVELVGGVRSFLDKIEVEKRDMTPEETQEYELRMTEIKKAEEALTREEELQRMEMTTAGRTEIKEREQHYGEFRSLADMLCAIRFNPHDPRLVNRASIGYPPQGNEGGYEPPPQHYQDHPGEAVSQPIANMDHTEVQGGYLVPPRFIDELLKIEPEDAVVRPRARVLPPGYPPDTEVEIPALDQGDWGILGGVQVFWIEEGEYKPATKAKFRVKTLKPKEVAGRIVVTDKLLRNTRVFEPLAKDLLRKAVIEAEEWAFLNGVVGGPTGIIGHGSAIVLPRNNANAIDYDDVSRLYAQQLMGGRYVWVANQSTLPQLMQLQDALGHYVWQPNAREGAPGTLFGFPVLMTTRNPALGTAGDLILADLKYYLIKDGSGPFVDALSSGDYYDHNKTVIKITWNVDGNPWPNMPFDFYGLEVSPFLYLGDPT